MAWTDFVYLSESRAHYYGFTHHGTIFGVPAWIRDDTYGDSIMACPKITALGLYTRLMDALLDVFTLLSGYEIELPYTVGDQINEPV